MRRRLPRLSGREVVKPLVRKIRVHHQKATGSHVVLVKHTADRKIVTVVPLHPELKHGTLLGILELARINREDFLKAYEEDC